MLKRPVFNPDDKVTLKKEGLSREYNAKHGDVAIVTHKPMNWTYDQWNIGVMWAGSNLCQNSGTYNANDFELYDNEWDAEENYE